MEKLKKTAKSLDEFFTIVLRLFIIIAVIMVVSTTVLCIKGGGDLTNNLVSMQLKVNGIRLEPGKIISASVYKSICLSTLFHFLILFAFTCYGIRVIRRMLSQMKEGRPFSANVSKDFKTLGCFTILFGIIYSILNYIMKESLTKLLAASFPYVTENAEQIHSLNFGIIAVAFFLLSYVFSYGEELQRLSDETL